ncbi:MAG TPA: pre-peptidase C-terminal domain-containing protein [Pirellulaceae bacterium]|nr:pre-peptidase C-terminal domain-containing protein [Pirellulaceae bacterium]
MSVRRFQMSQWEYKKRHKRRGERLQRSQRRLKLESLEERRLLAVGPQLAGIQPNDGALLQHGQIRDIAPSELVFRFNSGESIDPATLAGIQVTRAGLDGQFQRADAATDFNTNGTVLVDFVAKNVGASGDGISLEFIRNDLGNGVPPNIAVRNEAIFVELNSNSTTPTTAGELRDAITNDGPASTLIGASIRIGGGSPSTKIGDVDINYSPVVLDGANRAAATSNFNAGSKLQIKFRAVQTGPEGNGTRIFVTRTNRGGVSPPVVSVNDGNVTIDLNSNAASPTTAGEVVSAINSHPQASALVTVELQSGDADTLVGSRNINFSPIRLFGANDEVVEPGYLGLGGSPRDVTFRFKETLPDDLYHVTILGTGGSALRNVRGTAFNDTTEDGVDDGSDFGLDFELDLGARILSVVPQPLTRNPVTNTLQQARDQIHVYFNDDDLFATAINTSVVSSNPSVVDPAFYQLHFTNDTVHNTDDAVVQPRTILYDPAIDLAVLVFADDLDNLVGTGPLRLRIGNTEEIPVAPLMTARAIDQGSSFSTAQAVGTTLNVTGTGADTIDGQTITVVGGQTAVFEFEDTAVGDGVAPGNIGIIFNSGMTSAELADAIVAAINTGAIGVQASSDGGSRIALTGATVATTGGGLTSVTVQALDSLIISSSIDAMPFDLAYPGGNDDPGHREVPVENHLLGGADAVVGIETVFYNFRSNIGTDQAGEPLFNLITAAQRDRAREVFQIYGDALGVQFAESDTQGLTIATGDLRALSPTVPTGPGGVLGLAGGGVLIMDNAENWDDQFGATDDPQKFSWFETALHEIGHLLFLGHATELPPLTIMAGQGIGEVLLQFGNPIESVYPGAADLIHGEFLHRPESRDIDMYRVDVPESGLFSAEVFAERQPNSSLLDSVMTIYRARSDGSHELIARNDDYYSNDSFLELELGAGTYWIGISASGNDEYNPSVEDSGIGGVTQGNYDLRLNFRPEADRILRDATGTEFDGDGDGTPGGVFNSWFESQTPADTIFVDKAATGAATGSLSAPFSRISTAFAAAGPGDIVRIVGNAGADRNPATLADNLAYEIGFNRLGNVLADGATMEAPQGVTVMIDSGAIFKMFRSRVGVGSSSATVDRSGSALQVLGTPLMLDAFGRVVRDGEGIVIPGSVYLTSLHDDTIGLDTNPDAFPPDASPGDWGGLSFKVDTDLADANRTDHEARGIFLNHVNNADIRYGGGNVVVDGIPQIVAPIDISDARPTVSYNSITLSADSAISASPDSFAETNFHTLNFQFTPFTSDYQRIGPHIVGNQITDNSINGLFVRVSTPAAGELQTLTVAGRWDDNDITYVLAENLIVQGTPGGPVQESSPPSVELVTLNAALDLRVTGVGGDIPDGETLGLVNALSGILTIFEFESAGDGVASGNRTIAITPGMSSSVLAMTISSTVNSANIGITASVNGSNITFSGAADHILSVGLTTILPGTALTPGDYAYRVVFVDADGNEAAPSVPTDTITLVGSQNVIQLARLPLPSTGFDSRRIYRSTDPAAGVPIYTLVAEINATDTTFTDTGEQIGGDLRVNLDDLRPRLDARLAIDPGVVVKMNGATLETRFGGQIIAEGLDGQEVIFTSVNDDRFGRGGTFDVTNNSDRSIPTPGDWGGIFFGPSTRGSLDYSQVSYAGGNVRIAGNFASFNPVEIQQAGVRIAHSLLEHNADGGGATATPNRNGRGTNDAALIFVRGAQPVIIENTMVDNAGPVVNINANALDATLQADVGRTTYNRGEDANSPIGLLTGYGNNQGPLVRLNRLADNEINGMLVRGATLTTASVWDDTDVVHVLLDQTIYVPDQHTLGGLRLQSSPTESLVVKLRGANAGFTATGRPLDITDRIGGSLQIIGQPRSPVVLTSIGDDTVGAGFEPDGTPQVDTDNNGIDTGQSDFPRLPTGPEVNNGLLVDNDVLVNMSGHFEAQPTAGGNISFLGGGSGVTVQGTTMLAVNQDFIFEFMNYIDVGNAGAAINLGASTITQQPTLVSDDVVVSRGSFSGANGTVNWTAETSFRDGVAVLFNELTFDSTAAFGALQFISYLDEDIQGISDDFLYPSGTPGDADFRAFTLDGPQRFGFSHGGFYFAGPEHVNATYDGWAADQFNQLQTAITGAGTTYSIPGNIDTTSLPPFIDPALGQVYGPRDVTTAFAWTLDPTATTATVTSFLELATASGVVGQTNFAGDWDSVTIGQFANDRNVETITESEAAVLAAPGNNATIRDAQHIGALAPHEKAGDENLRLGFEAHGLISAVNDIDIYSFDAAAGTEVWFDIDRTAYALDSVIELIDANGSVLARSDNSGAETGNPGLLFRSSTMPANHIQPLRKSAFGEPDRYTTNPQDAGMRVVLPGPANTTNTYYVRIRSSSANLDQLDGGLTKGAYQLQVRLRETDEFPGSTIRHADIRNATNGIQVIGQPSHSPLVGEATEALDANGIDTNGLVSTPVVLGNVLNTDQAALGISGEIALPDDVDWFQFDVEYDSVQGTVGTSHSSLILDVDYADGFARPNTNLWVFDDDGNLVAIGTDSNVAEDRPAPLAGSSSDDLSRGSAGALDPFLGPVEFPAVGTAVGRYFVAVAANAVRPEGMDQFALPLPSNPLVRVEPANSLNRIAEDHINGTNLSNIATGPQVPVLFDQNSSVEFNLGDVTLYALQDSGVDAERLLVVNPFSGAVQNTVGIVGGNVNDITLHPTQGLLYGFSTAEGGNRVDANTGNYHQIDPRRTTTTSLSVNLGDDGIQTFNEDPMNLGNSIRSNNTNGVGIRFDAIEIGDDPGRSSVAGYAVGRRGDAPFAFGVQDQRNLLYEFNPSTGVALSNNPPGNRTGNTGNNPLTQGAWTQIVEHGALDTDNDPIGPGNTILLASEATTVAADGTTIFQITDAEGTELPGAVTFTIDDGLGNTVNFELNAGPEVRYVHSPQTGVTIRDGDTFFLDGLPHEFDTGSVLLVTATGNSIQDGDTFTITDIPPPSPPNAPRGPITRIFEFERQGGLNGSNAIAIPYTLNDNNLQIISSIVNAVNVSAQFNASAVAVGQRISILNENASAPVTENAGGPTITVNGAPGVRPGAFAIPVEESQNSAEFGNAIDQAMNGTRNASRDGDRINFSGAITANFFNVELRGVFTDIGSTGQVTAGLIPVNFMAADSASEVADSMVAAINNNSQIVAVRRGTGVQLQNGAFFVSATEPPLRIGGSAPGGDIAGMAFLNGRLFGVTRDDPSTFGVVEGGGLFEILFPSSNFAFADYIETASDLLSAGSDFFGNPEPIQFEGLTAGPPNAENGRYADMLFGIDTNGRLYAFDTTGVLQPVFVDGQTSVETGLFNVDGLAFSNLDYNLWHTTDTRRADPGHGVEEVFDGSRAAENTSGNLSYYFGYEGPFENGHPSNQKTNPSNSRDYDLIGGAHGSLISNSFSLKDYSSADRPTLYYSYFLDTENTNADLNTTDLMRDSFRVYASGEDGIWHLLTTNNSDRGEFDDPFFDAIDVSVQENFDVGDQGAPNSWRQVRIPLDDFAGQEDLRLRFDFDSAGGRGPAGQLFFGSNAALRQNTVGDELRALAGSRLRDAQTFTLTTLDPFGFGGTQDQFELDFGYTLVASTGAAISDGALVTVDGVDYIFDSDGFFSRNIQAVDGTSIADGDTFQVGDATATRTFEFEDSTNSPGVQPGNVVVSFEPNDTANEVAAAITNAVNSAGLSLTAVANGSVVEFSNGAFTFAPGLSALQLEDAFAVAFSTSDSASQVGASLANAITQNPPATPTAVGDLLAESNDTILTALDTTLTGITSRFLANGNIGDNSALLDVALDVDFLSFDAQVGDVVTVDVDANDIGTTLDAFLQLFDATGNPLAFSLNNPAPGEQFSLDPFISFTVPLTGTYYAAVSGEPNYFYDPLLAPTGIAGSIGDYQVEVTVTDAAGLLHRNGERINLPNAQAITQQGVPLSFIEGAPGSNSGFAINLHSGMSENQVANAISLSLASFYAGGVQTAFKTTEEIVHVVGHSYVTQSLGPLGVSPLGVSVGLFGDTFGAFEASTASDGSTSAGLPGAQGGQDNNHEGLYIDDIIVGFASRGELVTGDNGGTNFVGNGQQPDNEIDLGAYQLEIRRAPEFGVSFDPPVPTIFFTDSFDVNDRQTEQTSITAPAGNALSDGQTMVISDGLQELTFEFDDADLPSTHVNAGVIPGRIRIGFRSSQSANQIAELIRDTINSPSVQSILDVTAALSDGAAVGFSGQGNRINLYGNAIVLTSSGTAIGVTASINDIGSAFGSDDLFTFENRSATGEQITQVTITLPDPLFFEPAFGGNQPPTAPSGPDVNPSSDVVGYAFSFAQAINIDDTIVVDFTNFDPNERFIFGNDVDFSDNPFNYIGSDYSVTFSSGRTISGVFTSTGAGAGQVAVLDVADTLGVQQSVGFGDQNVVRPQGQILIHSNTVSNSLQFGIVADAGARDISSLAPLAGNLPHAGPVRVTREVNPQRLVTGVTIVNNLVARNGTGGILVSGDPTVAGDLLQLSAVPFGRVFNNTIVGSGSGVGIQVEENVSPTLLNNIVSKLGVGISVDPTATSTIIGGTVYQSNLTSVTGTGLGSFPISLTSTDPLFVDADQGNYYLAPGALAIDSAIDSLEDRPAIVTVKAPLGFTESPILAPVLDSIGQRRVDDPDVDTPPGQGARVFKDRGALDRADFAGPSAILLNPQDNDAFGADGNSALTFVELTNSVLSNFSIQLLDGVQPADSQGGTGADDNTVQSNRVTVSRDNVKLVQGLDYAFSYDATNNIIRLTSLAGIWESDRVYDIELSNAEGLILTAPDGASVTDGDSFDVTDEANNTATFEFESGYSLDVPQTLTLQIPAGGGSAITDGETFQISSDVEMETFEFDSNGAFVEGNVVIDLSGQESANDLANEIVTAINGVNLDLSPVNIVNVGGRAVHLGSRSIHAVDTSLTAITETGVLGGIEDGQMFKIDDGINVLTFEFTTGTSPGLGNRNVPFTYSMTHEQIADSIVATVRNAGLDLNPTHAANSDGLVHVGGQIRHIIDVTDSQLALSGQPGVRPAWGIRIPTVAGKPDFENALADGEVFTVSDGSGNSLTIELDDDGETVPGNTVVIFNDNTTTNQLANAIAIIIRNGNVSLSPSNIGNGIIRLNGTAAHSLDTTATTLQQIGTAGVPAAVPVNFTPGSTYQPGVGTLSPIFSAENMADSIAVAINSANQQRLLQDVTATAKDDEVLMDGVSDITGINTVFSSSIRDIAGNRLKPNRNDGTTAFTVFIGSGLDYGDAPDIYGTSEAANGARHQIQGDFFLGNGVDIDFNGQPSPDATGDDQDGTDDENGVIFSGALDEFGNTVLVGGSTATVTVTASLGGLLDAWIDFNADGDWDDSGEQIFSSQPLIAGTQLLPEFTVLGNSAQGQTFARFRLSSAGGLQPTGFADDGEVEDHAVIISANPWRNPTDFNDVNADGHVTPIDPLVIINYLNHNLASTDPLPIPRPLPDGQTSPPLPSFAPFLDVNGDGFATSRDVGVVINFLNNRAGGEGESLGTGHISETGEGEASLLAAGFSSRPVFVDHRLPEANHEVRETEVQTDSDVELIYAADWATSVDSDANPSSPASLDRVWAEELDDVLADIASGVEYKTGLNDAFFS